MSENIQEVNKINPEHIKRSLEDNGKILLEINIEYLQIEDCLENKKLKYINCFYKRLAENYLKYCENTLFKKLASSKRNESFRPYGEIMKYIVSYNSDEYLSVVIDVSHFDGFFKKIKRLSHTWSLKSGTLLSAGYFLKRAGKCRKQMRNEIGNSIMNKIEQDKKDYSYSYNSLRKYAYNANINNYFLCSKGIAFWFEPGTVAPEADGIPTFIFPLEI